MMQLREKMLCTALHVWTSQLSLIPADPALAKGLNPAHSPEGWLGVFRCERADNSRVGVEYHEICSIEDRSGRT